MAWRQVPDPQTYFGLPAYPNPLDIIGWLRWFAVVTINLFFQAPWWVVQLAWNMGTWLLDVWAVVWEALKPLFSWSAIQQLFGRALSEHIYFDIFRPVMLYLRDFWRAATDWVSYVGNNLVLMTGLLIRSPIASLSFALTQFVSPFLRLRSAFDTIKARAVNLALDIEDEVFRVELRVWQAFDIVRSRLDLTIVWANHYAHELGVLRYEPFAWTVYAYTGDVWAILLSRVAKASTKYDPGAAEKRWPTIEPAVAWARLGNGYIAGQPELVEALAVLRSGGR